MKLIIPILIFLLIWSNSVISQNNNFVPEEGDILFQDLDCGDFCNAVEKVTIGYKGARFSHVAMVVKNEKGEIVVIEAVSKGVSITAFDLFLAKSHDKNNHPKVIVGRLKPKYRHLIPQAVKEAYKLLGRPYDDVFCISNNKYYCSELIYDAFKNANNGKPIFKLYPMTFKDPDTKQFFPTWVEYFKDLKVSIPEGELGNGPGGISRSNKLKIVHSYGIPDGWK
ncbi:MAG: YiiX/YebB-like N1pC/P60 family cysteine hydrolase [Bacteroidales bacterium]